MEIVGLVHLVARVTAGHSSSSRFISLLKSAALCNKYTITEECADTVYCMHRDQYVAMEHKYHDIVKTQQKIVSDILTQAVEIAKENPNVEAQEKEVLIHIWDCGGQPIFLDMLPSFLTQSMMLEEVSQSHALFVVFTLVKWLMSNNTKLLHWS